LPHGSGGCHGQAYFLRIPQKDYECLVQRPPLQQFCYLPVFLHPLLECHVLWVCARSRLYQVIRENDQHPVPITSIPSRQSSVSSEADRDAGRTGNSPPYSSVSVVSHSPFRWSRPSICTCDPHNPQSDQVDNAGSVRVRIDGLSKVLHVLHQINGPVSQLFRNLPMREHPHELED